MTLREQRAAAYAAAKAIVANAGPTLTPAQQKSFDDAVAEVQRLDVELAKAAEQKARADRLGALEPGDNGPGMPVGDGGTGHLRTARLGAALVTAAKSTLPAGQKSLTPAGTVVGSIPVVGGPYANLAGERPPRLLDVLPAVLRTTPTYSVLRQTAHGPNAGVIAAGSVKPTSTFTVSRIDSRLKVVATLSEPVDKYTIEDGPNLEQWLGVQLGDAVLDAIEAQVLTGTGAGEQFQGLAGLAGVQAQPFVTDPLITVRHGIGALESVGMSPLLVALNPLDAVTITTTRTVNGTFDLGSAVDSEAKRLWGTPWVTVAGLPVGTAYVLATDSFVLSVDGGLRLEWAAPGDAFSKNQIVARVETRANLDALRPHGAVRLTLTGV